MGIEPGLLVVREHLIELKNWPKELAGYQIVLLTDLHVGSPHISLEKLRQVVRQTNALQPDLILLGGDYVIQGVVGGHPVPSAAIIRELSLLQAKNGVYGVLGNHDWWDDAPRICDEFAHSPVVILENEAREVSSSGKHFWLAGAADFSEGKPDLPKALAPIIDEAPVILLTHSPDLFPQVPPRVGLTIAGHTHGGQVYVPLLGRPVVPSVYGQRYVKGVVREGDKTLFIGTGIGTSIYPIRFLTPPEISVLRLYPAKPLE